MHAYPMPNRKDIHRKVSTDKTKRLNYRATNAPNSEPTTAKPADATTPYEASAAGRAPDPAGLLLPPDPAPLEGVEAPDLAVDVGFDVPGKVVAPPMGLVLLLFVSRYALPRGWCRHSMMLFIAKVPRAMASLRDGERGGMPR